MATVTTTPEPGQAVLVRGRPAAVRDVRGQTGNEAAAHLVEVEYLDGWEFPGEDTVLWEAEIDARVLQAVACHASATGSTPTRRSASLRSATRCAGRRWHGFPA